MRVIGGRARGHRLLSPPGGRPGGRGRAPAAGASRAVRPTLDRVRVTLFDILGQPLARPPLEGSSFLDLFAGTGSVGIEALSRGAGRVVLVESSPALCRTIRANLARTGLEGPGAEVRCLPARRALLEIARRRESFDVVFLDPPYEAGLVEATLKMVDGSGVVAGEGTLVAQHSPREEPPDRLGGLERSLRKAVGDTVLSFYRRPDPRGAAPGGGSRGGERRVDMSTAVYPGSFDPVTLGHVDLIERACRLFDRVVVAVFRNQEKQPLFTVEERVEMLREALGHLPNVTVDSFEGLQVEYAARQGAQVLIRGLRAFSDFEYELQMAQMNKKLNPSLETVFVTTSAQYAYVSSRIVKEIASFGGCVRGLVPPPVEAALAGKFAGQRRSQP